MNRFSHLLLLLALVVCARAAEPTWAAPMRKVHASFKGSPGTFAQFGDSITVTLAFWAPLEGKPKNASPAATEAHALVRPYQKSECWRAWKGPAFGSNGRMTVLWAEQNIAQWLAKLNPEVAVILFGSNDVSQLDAATYEGKLRAVVQRCLANGTIPIVTTMPPRAGHVEKSAAFAGIARKLTAELHVPLCDFHREILHRRPEDWNGALPQFKDARGSEYDVPTLIARDGVHPSNPRGAANDFSEESLRTNGYALRNYLTLLAYADVIRHVCQAPK
jgi:hypothetical protein